jgi:hypothetical protein
MIIFTHSDDTINIIMNSNRTIHINTVVHWLNAVRDVPPEERDRMLASTWAGQLQSKAMVVNVLEQHVTDFSNVYIFGGWTGILASMLFDSEVPIHKIRSIDIDPWCERVADIVNKTNEMNDWRFKAVTADMSTYNYQSDLPPDIVINTSSEHVTQEVYDTWYSRIPTGTLVVVQGNDFFSCPEHVRCSHDTAQFEAMNRVSNSIWSGYLCTPEYTRFMSVWRK